MASPFADLANIRLRWERPGLGDPFNLLVKF